MRIESIDGGVGGNDHCRVTRCGERLEVIGVAPVVFVTLKLFSQTLELPLTLATSSPSTLFAEIGVPSRQPFSFHTKGCVNRTLSTSSGCLISMQIKLLKISNMELTMQPQLRFPANFEVENKC